MQDTILNGSLLCNMVEVKSVFDNGRILHDLRMLQSYNQWFISMKLNLI